MKRNPSQQRAIAHLSGPMMVLAGPGSGKTSVIVERTAYMTTEGGISPSNILVVTFSRAAAKEMKERFLNFTGQEYTPITFGTFHGVFYGILKQAYGFTAANILSEEEKSAILRELALNHGGELAEEGDFSEEVARRSVLSRETGFRWNIIILRAVRMRFSVRSTGNMSKPVRRDGNWILMT